MTQIYLIEKEHLPSGQFSVSLKQPTYGDYRSARRRYPYPGDNGNKDPGYSVEEFFLATCIHSIDEKPVKYVNPIEVIEFMSIRDRQALTRLFVELFMQTREQAENSRDLAEFERTKPHVGLRVFSPESSPSGSFGFSIHTPTSKTQFEVTERYKGIKEQGCTLEEMLFAFCLHEVNGVEIKLPPDIISVLDNYEVPDIMHAVTIFININTIDESEASSIKRLGKYYKEKYGRTGQPVQTTTSQRSTPATRTQTSSN